MNKDELIELKNELLKKKRYVAISIDGSEFFIKGEPMTEEEIIAKSDTDNAVKKYEEVIEKTVITETNLGGDVTGVEAPVYFNFFCEEETAKELVIKSKVVSEAEHKFLVAKGYHKNQQFYFDEEQEYKKLQSELVDFISERVVAKNILPNYVMLATDSDMGVELRNYVINEEVSITDKGRHHDVAMSDVPIKVDGIVNYNDYFSKMKDLGYLFKSGIDDKVIDFEAGITTQSVLDMLQIGMPFYGSLFVDLIKHKIR